MGLQPLQGQGFDRLAVQALKERADERAAGLAATLDALKAEGITSANALAGALNQRGYATPRGGRWSARSVLNVTARLSLLTSLSSISVVATVPPGPTASATVGRVPPGPASHSTEGWTGDRS